MWAAPRPLVNFEIKTVGRKISPSLSLSAKLPSQSHFRQLITQTEVEVKQSQEMVNKCHLLPKFGFLTQARVRVKDNGIAQLICLQRKTKTILSLPIKRASIFLVKKISFIVCCGVAPITLLGVQKALLRYLSKFRKFSQSIDISEIYGRCTSTFYTRLYSSYITKHSVLFVRWRIFHDFLLARN